MLRIDDAGLRRMRVAAQLLHRPGRRSPADVVRHLVGIQAQAPLAAELGVRARAKRVTLADVDRARLEDRSVIRTWAMRGTIHLISAEDVGWLVPLTVGPSMPRVWRRLAEEGVPRRTAERAVGLIEDMLAAEGPLTRAEIAQRLRRRRIRAEGQAMAHLTWLAAARGVCCFGPTRGGRPTFVLLRDWVSEPRPLEGDGALAELATRYLGAHGPATPEDLAYWSGLRAADVRRAWALVADSLTEVETRGGTRWRLRSRRAEASPDLVRLLPMFDEYLLGWRFRDLVLPKRHRRRVVPEGGGVIHQAVVADGVVRGTWSGEANDDRLRVAVSPFGRPSSALRGALAVEARDVGRFRGLASKLAIV
ncbi:MAG: winged helix DNA-binding domain-containing protein [Actinomycetota bacterium]